MGFDVSVLRCLIALGTMRWVSLLKICGALIFFLLTLPLVLHLQDLLDQYDGYNYIASSLGGHGWHKSQISGVPTVGDKIIVMASLESEDTSWVAEELPEYAELKRVSST